jgi:hypothetical protein
MLLLMGLLAATCLASVPFSIWLLAGRRNNIFYSDVLFPGILAAGFVVLLMTIAITVALFRALGLQAPSSPLGLPEGTVAALIALVLILLFGMVGIFVFLNGADYRTVQGLSQDQVKKIDPADLLRIDCPSDPNGTCTVDRLFRRDQASLDIGKQLVTTVSTLVVAISAFYFGSTQGRRRSGPTEVPRSEPSAAPQPGDHDVPGNKPVVVQTPEGGGAPPSGTSKRL